MRKVFKVLKSFVFFLSAGMLNLFFTLFISFIVFISFVLFYLTKDIPNYNQIVDYKLPAVTRVYSSDIELVTEFAIENRVYIPIKFIPQIVINAFLAAEDKSFYSNYGVDFKGIIRSFLQNISNIKSNKLVGGSTITQQVVKNFFFTSEKTLKRKVQEVVLSFRINQILTKDQIMELYLNKVYFGNGAYGVATASLKYFNKSLADLTLNESALLASLPQSPSRINPINNIAKSLERRDWVLGRMLADNFISQNEYDEAIAEDIKLDTLYSVDLHKDDYFLEEVRRNIASKYGYKMLYEGGLYVHTTLNKKYQKIATDALRHGLISYDRDQGWRGPIDHFNDLKDWCGLLNTIPDPKAINDWKLGIILNKNSDDKTLIVGLKDCRIGKIKDISWAKNVAIGDVVIVESNIKRNLYTIQQIPRVNGGIIVAEVETGKVLSLVGGYDYSSNQFNVVTQGLRQPGSILKPFTFLSALNNKFSTSSVIFDEPLFISQGSDLPMWIPRNYESISFGNTPIRRGLELSRNLITVQLMSNIGVNNIIKDVQKFQLYKNKKVRNLSSFVLGSEVTTLFDLVSAYAIIANGGKLINLSLIEKIQDSQGKNLFLPTKILNCNSCNFMWDDDDDSENAANEFFPDISYVAPQVFNEESIYQLITFLEGTVKNGTSRRLKSLNMTLASKTGTSNKSNDVWVVGFTPKIVVGVYVGYDTPASLGEKATGARVAVPIFQEFMKYVKNDFSDIPFSMPRNMNFVKINSQNGTVANFLDKKENLNWEAIKSSDIDLLPTTTKFLPYIKEVRKIRLEIEEEVEKLQKEIDSNLKSQE